MNYVISFIFVSLISSEIYVLSDSCKDQLDNCKDYGKTVCEAPTYFRWAFRNCPQFCGFCQFIKVPDSTIVTTTTVAPSTAPCEDRITTCIMYVRVCKLQSYREWILSSCRKTCMLCSHENTTTKQISPTGMSQEGKVFG